MFEAYVCTPAREVAGIHKEESSAGVPICCPERIEGTSSPLTASSLCLNVALVVHLTWLSSTGVATRAFDQLQIHATAPACPICERGLPLLVRAMLEFHEEIVECLDFGICL